jgi:hypothetical protein
VGVASENCAVLACSGFAFVDIYDEVAGSKTIGEEREGRRRRCRQSLWQWERTKEGTHRLSSCQFGLFMKLHFRPLKNPAPPRIRSPESLIVWMIHESPFRRMSLVRCQSPRDYSDIGKSRVVDLVDRINGP